MQLWLAVDTEGEEGAALFCSEMLLTAQGSRREIGQQVNRKNKFDCKEMIIVFYKYTIKRL